MATLVSIFLADRDVYREVLKQWPESGTPLRSSPYPSIRQAIADGYFDVIVLRYGPTAALDTQIDGQLKAQRGYALVAKIRADDSYGVGTYYIWRADR